MSFGLQKSDRFELGNEEAVQQMVTQLCQMVIRNRKMENDLFARMQLMESDSTDRSSRSARELQVNLVEIIANQEVLYSSVAKSIAILTRMECKSQEEARSLVVSAIEEMGEVDVVIRYEVVQRVLGNIWREEAAGNWDRYKH